eukprot:10694223-Alexandrium_andersonii.AAC.1
MSLEQRRWVSALSCAIAARPAAIFMTTVRVHRRYRAVAWYRNAPGSWSAWAASYHKSSITCDLNRHLAAVGTCFVSVDSGPRCCIAATRSGSGFAQGSHCAKHLQSVSSASTSA